MSADKIIEYPSLVLIETRKELTLEEPRSHEKLEQSFGSKNLCQSKANIFVDIAEKIQRSKQRIGLKIQNIKIQRRELTFGDFQKNMMVQLEKHLKKLDNSINYLLSQGILVFFMDLLDFQEKISKDEKASFLLILLQETIEEMSDLLKTYFAYQEYRSRKKRGSFLLTNSILSSRQLNLPSQCIGEDKFKENDLLLLSKIESEMKGRSVDQLIKDYMQKQIVEIREKEEICRICFNKVKLDSIERHVKLCSKISDLTERLEEKDNKESILIDEMKRLLWKLNDKEDNVEKRLEIESLKKVITALLMDEKTKKQKGVRRKSQSNIENSMEKSSKVKWENYLFEHQSIYGKQQTLQTIFELQQQRSVMERHLNGLKELIHSQKKSRRKSQIEFRIESLMQTSSKSMAWTSCSKVSAKQSIENMSDMFSLNNNKDQILSQNSEDSEEDQKNCLEIVKSSLNQNSFFNFNDHLKTIRSKGALTKDHEEDEEIEKKHYVSLQHIAFEEEQKKISLQNFQILKTLGKGAYGKVYMVRRKETQDIYALKIIKLSSQNSEKDLQLIKTEHEIFRKIAGDHLVKAPFAFSEKESHIFVLQFMPGGDLRKLLDDQVYFEEQAAKFYLAEIILAIEHLHNYDIIHRDLKPQNLVINQEGHLKLTDFGLSAMTISKRLKNSLELKKQACEIKRTAKRRAALKIYNQNEVKLIGTPDYIAPQIINNISTSNKSIDWWSLGVMAYELIIGTRPFCADTVEEVIDNIRVFNIEWPEVGNEEGMISAKAKDLIEQLLNKDFINRLGANGVEQLKNHPFFEGVDWLNLKKQRPPFVPNIKKVVEYSRTPQNKILREELESHIGSHQKHQQKIKLQKFVRYDLLENETMQNVQKIFTEKTNQLRRLSTCRRFELQTRQKKSNSTSQP